MTNDRETSPSAALTVLDDASVAAELRSLYWNSPSGSALQNLALRLIRPGVAEPDAYWGHITLARAGYRAHTSLEQPLRHAEAAERIARNLAQSYRSGQHEQGDRARRLANPFEAILVQATCLRADLLRLSQHSLAANRLLDDALLVDWPAALKGWIYLHQGRVRLTTSLPGLAASSFQIALDGLHSPGTDPHWVVYGWVHHIVGLLMEASTDAQRPQLEVNDLKRFLEESAPPMESIETVMRSLADICQPQPPRSRLELAMAPSAFGEYMLVLRGLDLI